MTGRYELKNKGIRLEKVNDNNFIDLMHLEVSESQKDYVASNTVSMVQAFQVSISILHFKALMTSVATPWIRSSCRLSAGMTIGCILSFSGTR